MKYKDSLQKFIFENAPVRGEWVRLEQSYQEIANQHEYQPIIRELLGEALVIANLLGAIIKFKGRLTVQFQGKNPLKLLLAQCDHEHHFRGLVQYSDNPDKSEIIDALKKGTLAIMIDPQIAGRKIYQGIVSWQGNSLAQSIEGYFRDSEQLPTRLWIAVNQTKAVGLLLQIMPEKSLYSENDDWERIVHFTNTLKPDELLQYTNGELIHRLYSQEDVRMFDPIDVRFGCTCSLEKSENAILMLGREEAEAELKNKQEIAVTCEFCNKSFKFSRADVENIFNKR